MAKNSAVAKMKTRSSMTIPILPLHGPSRCNRSCQLNVLHQALSSATSVSGQPMLSMTLLLMPCAVFHPREHAHQNFTRIAMVARFSVLRRSGSQVLLGEPSQVVKPLRHTRPPGVAVLPPGGVTPPDPEKYGTFA